MRGGRYARSRGAVGLAESAIAHYTRRMFVALCDAPLSYR